MAPTGYNNTSYSSSGLSSRNNGLGRLGGSFQSNRGSLTKLSGGGISRASSVGGTAVGLSNVHVPKPVNTSSLRKENGGQDISTVLVNRQGGKVGWGSSLPEKQEDQSPVRDVKQHDPTPEEAVLKAGDNKNPVDPFRREISTNTSPSHYDSQNDPSSPKVSSKNTPWAFHPPNQAKDHGAIVGENPSHEYDRRYQQQHLQKDDTPHLQDEILPPSNQYDRSSYTVDRYHQDPYNRDYGGRNSRYYSNGNDGNRDEMMYRPSSNSYRRYPDQDRNQYRDSRDYNMNYSRPEQHTYERSRDRVYDRESTHDAYNNRDRDSNDRSYNHSSNDRYNPSRSDPRARDPEPSHSYRSYNLAREEYPSDNPRSDYARGSPDDYHGRHMKYDYSQRESTAGSDNHRSRSYVRSHSDVDRPSGTIDEEVPSRFHRDYARSERESHVNYSSSDPLRGAERKYDDTNRNQSRSFKPEPVLGADRWTPAASKPEVSRSMNNSSTVAQKPENSEAAAYGAKSRLSETENHSQATETKQIPVQENLAKLQIAENKSDNLLPQQHTYDKINEIGSKQNKVENATGTIATQHTQNPPQMSAHKWDQDDSDDSSHEERVCSTSPNLNSEQNRMNQQQMVLQRVQDVRDMRKKTVSTHENEIDNDAVRVARDIRKKSPSMHENKVANEMLPQPSVSSQKSDMLHEETSESNKKLDKDKSMEIYLAKREAERAARMEHRRTRGPRTRGVLFKREADGTIVNADLNRRGKQANQRGQTSGDSKSKSSRDSKKYVTASATQVPPPEMNNEDRSTLKVAGELKADNDDSDLKSENRDMNSVFQKGTLATVNSNQQGITDDRIDELNINPSSPPVSAWLSGPPPSIFSTNGIPHGNQPQRESERDLHSKDSSMEAPADEITSKLLSSWSSKNASKSKVAKGPIISTWSSIHGTDVSLFQPFHPSKQETPTGADWNMDFALPRDLLLSPTVEDNEEPSHDVDQAHSRDPAVTSSFHRTAEPRKNSRRSFAVSRKKPRVATKPEEMNTIRSQPHETNLSDSKPKSASRRHPNSTSETKEPGDQPKPNIRRFPNGTKNRNTKRNEHQTSV